MQNRPYILPFNKIGKPTEGYLSVCQSVEHVPFDIKRIFWTYYTPDSITRGRHAHHFTEMVLVALSGIIEVKTETLDGKVEHFTLKSPNEGLYLPAYTWHEMEYSHTSVQLVITNSEYDETDYIRSYEEFQTLKTNG